MEKLWSREQVADFLGVSLPTLDRLRKGNALGSRGPFPKPVAEVGEKPRWSPAHVDLWQRGEALMTGLLFRVELRRGESIEAVLAPMLAKAGKNYVLVPLPQVGKIGAAQILWPVGSGVSGEVMALLLEPLAGRPLEAVPVVAKLDAV